MDVERLVTNLVALKTFVYDIRVATGSTKGGDEILMCGHAVVNRAGFDHPRPSNHAWHTKTTFPTCSFFSTKRGAAAIRPGHHFGAVVGGVNNDGVVRNSEIIQFFEQLTDMTVVFDHSVRFNSETCLALRPGFEMRPNMHLR